MLRQSPHCSGVGMLRQSPHCSAGWGCYEIVPTAVQEVVKVTVKHNGENSIHSNCTSKKNLMMNGEIVTQRPVHSGSSAALRNNDFTIYQLSDTIHSSNIDNITINK